MPSEDPTNVETKQETAAETEAKRDRNAGKRGKMIHGVSYSILPGPIRTLVDYAQAAGPGLIVAGGILVLIGKIIDGFGAALKSAGLAGVALEITEKQQ